MRHDARRGTVSGAAGTTRVPVFPEKGAMLATWKQVLRSRRKRSLFALACTAGILCVGSCVSVPIPDRVSGGRGGSVGWKVVVGKHEPNLLVAADRTTCEVDHARFESAREGERLFCHWR